MVISAWYNKRTNKSVWSPMRTVSLVLTEARAVWTMKTSASCFACSVLHPTFSSLSLRKWMKRCLFVLFFRKSSFFGFDEHITRKSQTTCRASSCSSLLCGIFSCWLIFIAIKNWQQLHISVSHIWHISDIHYHMWNLLVRESDGLARRYRGHFGLGL